MKYIYAYTHRILIVSHITCLAFEYFKDERPKVAIAAGKIPPKAKPTIPAPQLPAAVKQKRMARAAFNYLAKNAGDVSIDDK